MIECLGGENVLDDHKVGVFLPFSYVVKPLLGGVKLKLCRIGALGGGCHYFPTDLYERTNKKFFINHLGVGTHVCHRRNKLCQLGKIFLSARLFIASRRAKLFKNGDKVHGLVELRHGKKGAENGFVLGQIKVLGFKLGHLFVVHAVGIEQHGAQHRLLRIETVWGVQPLVNVVKFRHKITPKVIFG